MNYKLKHIAEDEGSCLECGCELNGRKGQKFCSLVCKNTYHNRQISNIRRYRTDIISRLGRNHEILEGLMADGIPSIGLEELKAAGFDDSCMTGHRLGRSRHEECCCFDIVYYRSGSKIFGIRRIELPDAKRGGRR